MTVICDDELWHSDIGDAGVRRPRSGKGGTSEARSANPQVSTELWHAMEIQADIGICMYLLGLQSHEGEFEVAVLASLIVFFLLYELTSSESNTHPHPLVRMHILIQRTGTESAYEDDMFNSLLRNITLRLTNIGLFESRFNLSLDDIHQRSLEIEEASNTRYIPLFAPYRLDPKTAG